MPVLAFVATACLLFAGCQSDATKPSASPTRIAPLQIENAAQRLSDDISREISVRGMSLAQGVTQFYAQRGQRPAWQDAALFEQLLQQLEALRFDGLNPQDYGIDLLRQRHRQRDRLDAGQLAELDIQATQACLLALVHLYRGKIDPNRLDARWNFELHALDPMQGLQAVQEAIEQKHLAAVFERARPTQALYRQLRDGLQTLYRIRDEGGWPQIDGGAAIKPGMRDTRVPVLRQRLAVIGLVEAASDDTLYDADLQRAVKQYQREQFIDDDGVVGAGTLAALNVPVQARIDQVRANLERGRWQLHQIQGDFVLVDIAGYRIHFYRNGEPVWSSRVQVGRPYRSTPIFKSRITYVTFNPTWTIPPTIFRHDVLPAIRKDIGYLAKHKLRVLDSRGNELDASTIDWHKPGNILLRQDAGPDNPLGAAAIRFPNPYAVYMHDTPAQGNFSKGQRAFSSGCIRVERPRELLELLFNDAEKWNREAIDAEIATGITRDAGLKTPVPVLLMYWTVDIPAPGRVGFKQDIYERDPPIVAALDRKQR